MNIDSVTIRPMQTDEVEAVANLRALGFEGNKDKILSRLLNNPRYDTSHILIADYQGEVVGTATVFPAQMWLSGVPVKVGAVAGVTVLAARRNQGIAAKLMETSIARMRAEGQALSVLFPFSHQYYNKFGYGTVSDLHAYRFTPENLAVSGDVSKVRPFSPDDLPLLRVVYKGQMTWHNGWFTRSNAWWDKMLEYKWPKIVVFDDDDMIDGYCVYQISKRENGERVLNIKEFFAGEAEAYQGLLAYLAAQNEGDVIEYLAPADTPLRHSLRQPIAEGAQNRGWIFNDLCHITPGPMGRIINLSAAMTARFYTRGISGKRVFKVTDPLIPKNEEPILFRLVDGRAETQPAGDSPVQIKTDVVTLSQILCGYLTAVDARRLGRFKTDEDTCSWLDKIIVDSPLYIQSGDWF